jgi:hypothetical protein
MNERIEKLANVWANLRAKDDRLGITYTFSEKALEQFAELVVQECADILMKPEYAMNHPEELGDYNKGWVNGRLLGIEHIKEHFGVKE